MEFFKPDDFNETCCHLMKKDAEKRRTHIAELANAKLKLEGKIVFGTREGFGITWDEHDREPHRFKTALLIDIKDLQA